MRRLKNDSRVPFAAFVASDGMTLIEILITLTLIAGLLGVFVSAMGGSAYEAMRGEAARLMGTIRYVYYQAAAKSQYSRIVFDLSEQKYFVETSEEPFYIPREDDETEAMIAKNREKNKGDVEGSEEGGEGTTEATTLAGEFAEDESEQLEIFEIDPVIKIADVFIGHQKEPVAEGKAYLYFFPKGQTEFAVIHFSDEEESEFITLIVNPLTGRVEIETEFRDYNDYVGGK